MSAPSIAARAIAAKRHCRTPTPRRREENHHSAATAAQARMIAANTKDLRTGAPLSDASASTPGIASPVRGVISVSPGAGFTTASRFWALPAAAPELSMVQIPVRSSSGGTEPLRTSVRVPDGDVTTTSVPVAIGIGSPTLSDPAARSDPPSVVIVRSPNSGNVGNKAKFESLRVNPMYTNGLPLERPSTTKGVSSEPINVVAAGASILCAEAIANSRRSKPSSRAVSLRISAATGASTVPATVTPGAPLGDAIARNGIEISAGTSTRSKIARSKAPSGSVDSAKVATGVTFTSGRVANSASRNKLSGPTFSTLSCRAEGPAAYAWLSSASRSFESR